MRISYPEYYEQFTCIAANCPDSCCKEWCVDVDKASADYYRALPGPLGDRLRQVLQETDDGAIMAIENGRCPMWREDGLCEIQAQLGHDALCKTCQEFPRLRHDYGTFAELGLELSCPAAAQLILTSALQSAVETVAPGDSQPEYDQEAMDVLLASRQEALELLKTPDMDRALSSLLLYGYHTQAVLDGAEATPFDDVGALAGCRGFAKASDRQAILRFFEGLEILTDGWRQRLAAPQPGEWSEPLRALARYGIQRYWLQAVSDYDLVGRVKLIVISCLLVKELGGDPVATAQLFSKEIENNPDNVEAVLDAAYAHPAFTDARLLGLLHMGGACL